MDRAQARRAAALRDLHRGGRPLILPNVWNPVGARVLERHGYPAVATASAAVAASLGYRDGERLSRDTMLAVVARIASSVDVPVTADVESGYAGTLAELEDTTRAVIASGAVGMNLEDSVVEGGPLREMSDQAERIACVRAAADSAGVPLVLNARIDCYLSSAFPDPESALEETVRRADAYADAGADCVYPVGPGDETTVRALRGGIRSPLNVFASPRAAPLTVLAAIGVNRVSFGPFLFRSLLRRFVDLASSLREMGPYGLDDVLSGEDAAVYLRDESEASPASDR